MRSLPFDFDPDAAAAIDSELAAIREFQGVRIPWAIESGSRAWGFPSPDSDYDCRFIFVCSLDQLVSPWARRDFIERPCDHLLDVNGWDLGKAIRLILKGNAVVIEWLRSPVIYHGEATFRDRLLGFAHRRADRTLITRHYLHLGERQRRVYFGDGRDVPQKKIFYALRPAATLRWLRIHPGQSIAPMHFPTLMTESEPPREVAVLATELIARKAVTRELGAEPLPKSIAEFIDHEFSLARDEVVTTRPAVDFGGRDEAEALFRELVYAFQPHAAAVPRPSQLLAPLV